ncbi:MAG: Two component transcriptional regulator, LuxR family [Candidatus Wolfebacteria bacterium GW2011_GWE1_48_7]|uniref:Two component transcriptional regulator, LuxR family n=2 Tax=Candidatus Wolfeibacteriota TaxID=1752735 RepID=A0A0G1WH49_9BACT|nr:MAG: two-component response regulator, two-component system, OmpR family, response regulator RpaA [Candidatus Wolfebacteria bacterium GW2011_GWB1_47_1]KKU36778.1 MAG: Two component transcriptional regulator, LuxR family [Candidatus Wolfebacteria bacterium GW2011_GWC2_46_275]KKU42318.1 MAG: Two component transcriptional regulator, LuxR family [Candidatus Wolfebacteria bacterium GW2011_GWB2_46_69]KKU53676.1 MAG: Two component transcriptional regulator, LuxR family [Candidatus Wolfebacteria bact
MEEIKKRILVVDDDPALREIFGEKLVMAGFLVSYAKNGYEGYDLARSVKPDFILLDVMMPELDGPATLDKLKSDPECKDIPVAFLTSIEDRPEDVKAAKEVGAIDYWNKAMELDELVARVSAIVKNK